MRLRGYQEDAVATLGALLGAHRAVLAVAPTGAGKTVVAATLIAQRPGARVLWVAHRIELLRQAREQLHGAGIPARDIGILSGPDKENVDARVLVVSAPMVCHGAPVSDLVVVDEAHRVESPTYRGMLRTHGGHVLGLTATPWRLDNRWLGDTFGHMEVIARPTQLIAEGHVAHPITYGLSEQRAREMVAGVSVARGDFAGHALGAAMMRGTLMGDVVAECDRLAPGVATLVFAASRAHGLALAERFAASRGVRYLDGETGDAERQATIAALGAGDVDVVVNVDVLTEGFDCPAVKCIAMARPTKSLTRYLQYVGRASRPFKGQRPIILDHAGNSWRHDLPEVDRDWESMWLKRATRSGAAAPVRICYRCGAMLHAGVITCTECGAERVGGVVERVEVRAELERIALAEADRVRTIREVTDLARRRGFGDGWVRSVLKRMEVHA